MYGDETVLAERLDLDIRTKKGRKIFNRLVDNELRYGWLWNDRSGAVDEVLLARPGPGFRILTCHGGAGIMASVAHHLESIGVSELKNATAAHCRISGIDDVWDPLLAACLTESQVAAVLAARTAGRDPLADPRIVNLLRSHRIVLAGPPNAGKSSLLNRLCGYDRAFVHHKAGATRDVVDETVDLGGFAVHLLDLPGFADSLTGLDKDAWRKATETLAETDAIFFVFDASVGWDETTNAAAATIAKTRASAEGDAPPAVLVLASKSDLPNRLSGTPWQTHFADAQCLSLCSLPGGNARDTVETAVFTLLGGKTLA